MQTFSTLLTQLDNGILTVTINRPDKLNALNQQVMQDLSALMDAVQATAEIRSVVLTGAGDKAFVAGADIAEFTGATPAEGGALAKRGQDIFFKIENSPKPVVAAVNGFALGGGCELAMACHFRIASENARFGQPEVNLGLVPGYGGTQRLVQLIGKGRALELLMGAGMVDAATALQYGLVNHVVPAAELLPKAIALLTQINSKAPLAVAGCIRAANAVFDPTQDGYAVEVAEFTQCFSTQDMVEGTTAFLEKRKAQFKGE